jgi:hypothetical protein
MRNPNQRMLNIPPMIKSVVREVARSAFERVIVFNDPEGVIDPRPPHPRYLDLL